MVQNQSVCQHWRNIAVTTSFLWTEPPTHHHDLTMLMLKRSKKADLCIYLTCSTPDDTITAIIGQIERIRSLSILGPTTPSLRSCFDILRSSPHDARRLEIFKIFEPYDNFGTKFSTSGIPLRQLPRLRDLVLAGVTFDWSILPLTNLTNLLLHKAGVLDGILPHRLVEYLSQMQHLESIELSSGSLMDSPTNPPVPGVGFTVTTFKLPRLFSLKIQYVAPQQLEVILSPLILPRLRLLEIIVEYVNFSSFMRIMSSIFLNGDFDTCDVLVSTFYSFRLIPSEADPMNTLSVGLGIQFLNEPSRRDGAMKIMAGLDGKILSRTTKLVIKDYSHYNLHSDELVHNFASYFPHLECLQVRDTPRRTLINCLDLSCCRATQSAYSFQS